MKKRVLVGQITIPDAHPTICCERDRAHNELLKVLIASDRTRFLLVTSTRPLFEGMSMGNAGSLPLFPAWEEDSMNVTVRKHVQFLSDRLQELRKQSIHDHLDPEQLNNVESEIRAATLAIAYYQAALQIEQRLVRKTARVISRAAG
jgi:hypothetical protein